MLAARTTAPIGLGLRTRPLPFAIRAQRSQRSASLRCNAAASKAAASTAAASASQPGQLIAASPAAFLLSPQTFAAAVTGACAFHVGIFTMMIAAPRSITVRMMVGSYWMFVPLALIYLLLLVNSWSADSLSIILPGSLAEGLKGFNPQFFPQLDGIATLFSRPATAASWLVHIITINVFLGRTLLLSSYQDGIPVRHSLALAAVFGPLGLLSHLLTKLVLTRRGAGGGTEWRGRNGGRITILPYDEKSKA